MLRGLLRLTWIEIKVFMREPLGAIGSIVMPVILYVLFARLGRTVSPQGRVASSSFFHVNVPVIVAILIAINTVLSLIAIVSIYRDGGILKRLRATPLRPWTIAVPRTRPPPARPAAPAGSDPRPPQPVLDLVGATLIRSPLRPRG